MGNDALTPQQRRTFPARKALAAKFSSPKEKFQFYRGLAEREATRRRGGIVLSADEAASLAEAYAMLQQVARRIIPPPSEDGGPADG
jgi:hypothetical protein